MWSATRLADRHLGHRHRQGHHPEFDAARGHLGRHFVAAGLLDVKADARVIGLEGRDRPRQQERGDRRPAAHPYHPLSESEVVGDVRRHLVAPGHDRSGMSHRLSADRGELGAVPAPNEELCSQLAFE